MWARPYGTWGIQAVEVTALHWRKHNLVKITRIFFLFQFFQWRPERKDFLPQTTVLIHHLDSKRTCTSGSIPSGTGLWRWLARQEARRESSKGETASVHVRALQESCWWLYRWFAVVLSVSYVLHRTVLLLDLCPARFICDETQQTGWKAYCFFLWCIPQWSRTHMKVPEIQALLLLFPNTVFVFFRVWLNCSLCVLEFKLSQRICGQVCTEFTEFGKHGGGSQFSYRLLFSVTSLLLAENGDGPCSQPCKV